MPVTPFQYLKRSTPTTTELKLHSSRFLELKECITINNGLVLSPF